MYELQTENSFFSSVAPKTKNEVLPCDLPVEKVKVELLDEHTLMPVGKMFNVKGNSLVIKVCKDIYIYIYIHD